MARVNVKYPIGSRVHSVHEGGIDGVITAVFIRGRNRAYEFSYVNNDGNPTSVNMEEIELEPIDQSKAVGFRRD